MLPQASIYGSGACGRGNDFNKDLQDADQVSFATFGNYTIIVDSTVWCYAPNSDEASPVLAYISK